MLLQSKAWAVTCREELWEMVKRVWERMSLSTIARAYAGHHQITNAIFKCDGGDDFAREQKGLHCGIRKMYVPYYASDEQEQPSGVEVFESNDAFDAATLKYETPDVSDRNIADFLTLRELEVIMKHLPVESPEWGLYATAATEKYFKEMDGDQGSG